jgi:four helix bundle protein
MHKLEDLKIWQKSLDLAVEIYQITADFPSDEKFGLISQIKRCAVSISSNIAEGAGRNSNNEFKHFLSIANGSSYELQTQLILANKLGFLNNETLNSLIEKIVEIQKMNYAFQNNLNKAY